jgi:hypothetical protein
MTRLRVASTVTWAWMTASAFALAAVLVVPLGVEAHRLLSHEDDPVAIADRALDKVLDQPLVVREIESALDANDADLAASFVELAQERRLPVPDELAARVRRAVEKENSAGAYAQSFARGLVTGEPDDAVGLVGTVAGDLFVFGDIRDALREGSRYARGEKVDELVLGLSIVGLAITAGTYASLGAGAPARVGLSAVKAARKTGRLSTRMADWIGRSVREAVDWSALRRAGGSLADPALAARTARQAVKTDKAGGLLKLAGDVGTVQTKAGTRGALDALRISQGPQDMARVAKLAEKKGGKTRAILKTLGRGAIVLSMATFNLAMWILGAIATLFGLVSSAKSGVERMTQRSIDRRKARARERYAAMTAVRA